MKFRTAAAVAILFASSSPALAAIVRHAGEWATTIGDGQPLIACFTTDQTLDQAYVAREMAKIPKAQCQTPSLTTLGPVTSFTMQCMIGGSLMTSTGTITQTGPDSFSSKTHTHGGVIMMGPGKSMAIPDGDQVTTSRRTGPCKPGDRQVQ